MENPWRLLEYMYVCNGLTDSLVGPHVMGFRFRLNISLYIVTLDIVVYASDNNKASLHSLSLFLSLFLLLL